MFKHTLMMVSILAFSSLTGCETIKSTISGPFIGLEKDMNKLSQTSQTFNTKLKESIKDPNAPQATNDEGLFKNLDSWMQKNWW